MSAATRTFAAGALLATGAVAAALVSQHVYDMQPCPWCVLQRLIFVAIAAACGIGLLWRAATGRTVAATLALALALSGVAAALYQNRVAAKTESCAFTFPERFIAALRLDAWLPDVFQARASCIDAAVDLWGVPYEFYSLALYAAIAAGALALLLAPNHRAPALSRT
ncbi:disulfide bond formation protein B [Azohydromonas sediminis]|uniref:disulfide bond formation protein B n=1 Tax=Azohydromonas sediminis TaxID=2259674 RepID=UPI000E657F37|nr:disulfide bond formation protein B [Azohydromonas sediminis]